jgi:hypothetical protein
VEGGNGFLFDRLAEKKTSSHGQKRLVYLYLMTQKQTSISLVSVLERPSIIGCLTPQVLDQGLYDAIQQNGDFSHFYFCYRW